MYEIEKGIPIPEKAHANCKYPWDKMEVGDSFVVPRNVKPRQHDKLRCYASGVGKKRGQTFYVKPEGENGFRIWRTA